MSSILAWSEFVLAFCAFFAAGMTLFVMLFSLRFAGVQWDVILRLCEFNEYCQMKRRDKSIKMISQHTL